jgi:hypothetical protein
MKVFMDRLSCPCWQASCESSFGWRLVHLLNGKILPGGCMVDFEDDNQKAITFYIHDHDGDKVLEVNDKNWPDAYDSWLTLWQRQAGTGNH